MTEAPPEHLRPLHVQPENGPGGDDTAMRIMAKSIVRELGKHGYGSREAIVLSTELVRLISDELKHHRKEHHASPSNGGGHKAP
uniref:Uncharacterized protein n=1 Tax=Sorangium cellulosum TaxID=56 RepID=A0A3S7V057_SORCE|nr:hypothetical protein [Sorangium cellulosum]